MKFTPRSSHISRSIHSKALATDVRDSIYGLIVDKVEHVMHISPKEIEPVPSDSFESYHYIKGIAKTQGQLLVLLDIIALLEDSEDNSDEEFQQEIETTNEEKDQTPISEIKSNLEDTEDDIPEELKEVFREDEEKDISREVPK